jgi:hypothetical protein
MYYVNIRLADLRTAEFTAAELADRGTWLALLSHCVDQENSGTIRDCRTWNRRQWQALGLDPEDLTSECRLWTWSGDDLRVWGYPEDQEHQFRRRREAGRLGGIAPRKEKEEEKEEERKEKEGSAPPPAKAPALAAAPSDRNLQEVKPSPRPHDGLVEIPVRQVKGHQTPTTWWLTPETARTIAQPLGLTVEDVVEIAEDLVRKVKAGARGSYTFGRVNQGLAEWVARAASSLRNRHRPKRSPSSSGPMPRTFDPADVLRFQNHPDWPRYEDYVLSLPAGAAPGFESWREQGDVPCSATS